MTQHEGESDAFTSYQAAFRWRRGWLLRPRVAGSKVLRCARPFQQSEGRISGKAMTGKERLSDIASDEQRADNCKVPFDRRGVKTRPDE
jgi:hypothetical protein